MSLKNVYEKLAKKMDTGVVVGAPMAPSLLKILAIIFPGEEAKLALKLPFAHQTLEALQPYFPEYEPGQLKQILESMVSHGTVFTKKPEDGERVFRLLPSIVGWAETPYWSGKATETTKALSPHWVKYREEGFAEELARGNPPSRVVPIDAALKDSTAVLPFDVLKDTLTSKSYLAVAHCPCRMVMKGIDQGCEHSTENCLHFGSMGKYMVEHKMARQITGEEAVKILEEADQEGLVHMVDNYDGPISTVCNCCGCCCLFQTTKKRTGLSTYAPSNYVSSVDEEDCVACGSCVDRCSVDAISLEDTALVDGNQCIGCGVCVPTCPTSAIGLVQRETVAPPPSPEQFLMARLKTA